MFSLQRVIAGALYSVVEYSKQSTRLVVEE